MTTLSSIESSTVTSLRNFSDVPTPVKRIGEGETELIKWAIICGAATIFGLSIATIKFVCDTYYSPANKIKRTKKAEHERKDKEKRAVLAVRRRLVSTEDFRKVYRRKKIEKSLTNEVRAIVLNQPNLSMKIGLSPENINKNFSPDIVTSDEARVVLEEFEEGETDYINASFIPDYLSNPKHYIASQSPDSLKTCREFWQMVWQEGVSCIVMAMGLFHHISMRCAHYWEHPINKDKFVEFGPFRVRAEETEVTTFMVKRRIMLYKEGVEEGRQLTHLEFLSWTDDDSTIDPAVFLSCRHHTRMEHKSGPLLVHCSCGASHTAMFIVIDYCLEQIDNWACVDIYSTVLHLREFRSNMMRTLSQYRAIHDAVSLYICSGHTIIPYTQLPTLSERMAVKDPHKAVNSFQTEFKLIKELQVKMTSNGAAGHHIDNRGKSRNVMMQPDDQYRPYLNSADNYEDTEYINAVYIDGFKDKNKYIITEWPLNKTINSFWRLLYDHNISSVVLLNNISFSLQWPRFWPQSCNSKNATAYGPIGVLYHDCIKTAFYVIRVFIIYRLPKMKTTGNNASAMDSVLNWSRQKTMVNQIEERVVKVFQLKDWRCRECVPQSAKPLMFLYDVVEEWQQTLQDRRPIVVMSRDGYRRCGLFITIHIGSLALKEYGEVDIFNIVRIMKKRRCELVSNEAEYMFCYRFLSTLIELVQQVSPGALSHVDPTPDYRHNDTRSSSFSRFASTDTLGKFAPLKTLREKLKVVAHAPSAVIHKAMHGHEWGVSRESDSSTSDDSYKTVNDYENEVLDILVHNSNKLSVPGRPLLSRRSSQQSRRSSQQSRRSSQQSCRSSISHPADRQDEPSHRGLQLPPDYTNLDFPFNPFREPGPSVIKSEAHKVPTIIVSKTVH